MALNVLKYFILAYIFLMQRLFRLLYFMHQFRQVYFHEIKGLGNENTCQKCWYIFCATFRISLLYFSDFSVWRNLSWITMHATVADMRRCRGFWQVFLRILFFFQTFLNQNHIYIYSLKLFSQIYDRHFFQNDHLKIIFLFNNVVVQNSINLFYGSFSTKMNC